MAFNDNSTKGYGEGAQAIPPILYHYCSMNYFIEIIKSRQLWLSNYRCLNDPSEGIWFDKIIKDLLDDFNKNTEDWEEVYETLDSARKILFDSVKSYIFCFSTKGDSLSQWKVYADDAKGVTIGFDLAKFGIPVGVPGNKSYSVDGFGLCSVVYNKQIQKTTIEKVFNEFSPNNVNDVANMLIEAYKLSCIFKNPSYKEETEWRLIFRPDLHFGHHSTPENYTEKSEKLYNNTGKKVYFRNVDNRVIPYFIFNQPKRDDLIKEVILGPKNNNPPGTVKLLLSNYNYLGTIIKKSSVPHR